MMPSNIEIKAKLPNGVQQAEQVVLSLRKGTGWTVTEPQDLLQVDTFFNVPNGRMKLRNENGQNVLITYFRSDIAGPKESEYTLCPIVDHADKLLKALSDALSVKGVVEKERRVYLVTWDKDSSLVARVHLDKVKHVGEYLEFEVVLVQDGKDHFKKGQEFANELVNKFGIQDEDLATGAYMDILQSS